MKQLSVFLVLVWSLVCAGAAEPVVWLEAERFENTGGWSNDSQFVDLMGSPYLLAAGVGHPVADAVTHATLPTAGKYKLWVRCKDWFTSHSPGKFQLLVNGKASPKTFGQAADNQWQWIEGGAFELPSGEVEVRLHDLTGWWGRCDAVVLAGEGFTPSNDLKTLAQQREQFGGVSARIEDLPAYDVVVVGGGMAGCGTAVAAARHGCRVALIQDRPVLGGNASSEVEVPVEGDRTNERWDPFDTGLIEEFSPEMREAGQSKRFDQIVRAEKLIDLHLDTRATGVEMKDAKTIGAVLALEVKTGKRLRLTAPVFIDCTGHGWVGFWAGADFHVGEEARSEYNEPSAPAQATRRTMGNDLYFASFRNHTDPMPFEAPAWAYHWNSPDDFEPLGSHKRLQEGRPPNFDGESRGKGRRPPDNDPSGGILHCWQTEYGGQADVIQGAELIRDELFRINVGLWDYAKNHNPKVQQINANRELVWLSYVMGVREGRRLLGDYVVSENDYIQTPVLPDAVAFSGWGMDVHHPEGFWVRGNDCMHYYRVKMSIPFRSLYSRNIENLMMAGRCHSASHLGCGGTRIIRTCCEMGEAVGDAAALIKKYKLSPRDLCSTHIGELQQMLLKDGAYLIGVPNRDPADLALKAKATASSEAPAEKGSTLGAGNVNNGWNRAVKGVRNAWVPDLQGSKLPQWVQLELPEPSRINCLHVSFQTRKDRGVDFAVETFVDGQWRVVSEIAANTERRRVIRFDPVQTAKVRLTLKSVAGKVGVCEIRLYND